MLYRTLASLINALIEIEISGNPLYYNADWNYF
jgi:hypothetical protein